MTGTAGPEDRPTIDQLLDEAQVLQDRYDDYDADAVCDRILRTLDVPSPLPAAPDRTRAAGPPDCRAGQPEIMAEPALYATDHEQAAHDLDLAVSLVVGDPQAAASLARLRDGRRADPHAALVFACLLHLIGHTDAAQFWWQYAAGGGSRNAAFCLYLHHRCRAEHRDAAFWRERSRQLADGAPPCPRQQAPVMPLLLAESVGRALLSQVRRDDHPRLPPAVEAVLNGLRVDDHGEFGEVPVPGAALPRHLADAMT